MFYKIKNILYFIFYKKYKISHCKEIGCKVKKCNIWFDKYKNMNIL